MIWCDAMGWQTQNLGVRYFEGDLVMHFVHEWDGMLLRIHLRVLLGTPFTTQLRNWKEKESTRNKICLM
jgi:hypothetical protein